MGRCAVSVDDGYDSRERVSLQVPHRHGDSWPILARSANAGKYHLGWPMYRLSIVLAVAFFSPCLAAIWCRNPSECLYLAVPPIALTLFLIGQADVRAALRARIRPALTFAAGLLVLAMGLAFLCFGPAAVLSWRFWLEAGTCLYFLLGAFLMLFAVRRSLLAFAGALHERWQFAPGVRMIVCEVVPLGLFVFFTLPYVLAFSHVHRFKMPNLTDPHEAWQRSVFTAVSVRRRHNDPRLVDPGGFPHPRPPLRRARRNTHPRYYRTASPPIGGSSCRSSRPVIGSTPTS